MTDLLVLKDPLPRYNGEGCSIIRMNRPYRFDGLSKLTAGTWLTGFSMFFSAFQPKIVFPLLLEKKFTVKKG